jgi:hypothetical protein
VRVSSSSVHVGLACRLRGAHAATHFLARRRDLPGRRLRIAVAARGPGTFGIVGLVAAVLNVIAILELTLGNQIMHGYDT